MIVSKGTTRDDHGYSAFEGTVTGPRRRWPTTCAHAVSTTSSSAGLATDYCVRASVLDARRLRLRRHRRRRRRPRGDLVEGAGARALEEMREAGADVTPASAILS